MCQVIAGPFFLSFFSSEPYGGTVDVQVVIPNGKYWTHRFLPLRGAKTYFRNQVLAPRWCTGVREKIGHCTFAGASGAQE